MSRAARRPARSTFAAAASADHRAMHERKVVEARARFVALATEKGWDVRTRDGLDDYFEERVFYAWLGYRAAATGGTL